MQICRLHRVRPRDRRIVMHHRAAARTLGERHRSRRRGHLPQLVVHRYRQLSCKHWRYPRHRRGFKLIEDAACAIGAEYEGRLIGALVGDMVCFSFHPRKILTTGEGGMITTADAQLAERLRRLRQHAMSLSDVARHNARQIASETYDEVGFNFRMTDMQAAIGITQLGRLGDFLKRRRYLAARYTSALQNLPCLQTPLYPPNTRHNY